MSRRLDGEHVADREIVGQVLPVEFDRASAEMADHAPAAYFATLPVVDVAAALLDAGVPARVSNTARTHLCNNVLYQTRAQLEAAGSGADVPMGFVHLPLTPAGAADRTREGDATSGAEIEPSLPLALQTDAVRRSFEVGVREGSDEATDERRRV